MNPSNLTTFLQGIPKTELHLHIEGTFEPELMFEIAKRNHIAIRFDSVDAVRKAYSFNNLQEFLDIYYEGAGVLITEADFYDLTMAYLARVHAENVVHVEIFFDPQTHTERGVAFDTVIRGIHAALEAAKTNWGMTYKLIMSYLRHLDEASAFATLAAALPYKAWIYGVGLDSSEVGNPPAKFERVFAASAAEGFVLMAHAGEEGPPEYIWEALNLLHVARIDHGNRCLEDEALVQNLIARNMGLTVCPLSNLKLKVVKDMREHPIQKMMELGLLVTVNSDDPAYFGGYMVDNFVAVAEALKLSKAELTQLVVNGFEASFMDSVDKAKWIEKVQTYSDAWES